MVKKFDVEVFDSGDGPYFQWLADNLTGFVVNTGRSINSTATTLHKSECGHITPGETLKPGAYTQRASIKVCSTDPTELLKWIKQKRPRTRGFSSFCPDCKLPPILTDITYPDQIHVMEYWEGATRSVVVNAYERNSAARQQCIDRWGLKCSVCDMEFEKTYGAIGKGFIHVHHLRPLAEIDQRYQVDPVNDLRPVCPNCHAMLHRGSLSIEELKKRI